MASLECGPYHPPQEVYLGGKRVAVSWSCAGPGVDPVTKSQGEGEAGLPEYADQEGYPILLWYGLVDW